MDTKEIYNLYKKNYLVDTDTRKIRKGSVFFALRGENFNGNEFAKTALEKGASFAIIDEKKHKLDDRFIIVENALKSLQNLANFHRKELNIPVIGLTGSNGKTTTKELIASVLKTTFNTFSTQGNLNNHIGVPLTLLSMNSKTEIGVVEMGANHQKEIEFLSKIAQPNFGYITNFGKAHLEGFGGVEGVIKGKSELYQFLRKYHGTVFVNSEDKKQVELTEEMNREFLNSSIQLKETHPFLVIDYNNSIIQTQLLGVYNFSNILAAITIGEYFKVNKEDISNAISNYVPNNNRSQVIHKGSHKIILDAYNANPSSVIAALNNFHLSKDDNKIVILGDMFELGIDSKKEHQAIVNQLRDLKIEYLLIGKNFFSTNGKNKFEHFEDALNYLKQNPLHNSSILIKGSRGMALERLLTVLN